MSQSGTAAIGGRAAEAYAAAAARSSARNAPAAEALGDLHGAGQAVSRAGARPRPEDTAGERTAGERTGGGQARSSVPAASRSSAAFLTQSLAQATATSMTPSRRMAGLGAYARQTAAQPQAHAAKIEVLAGFPRLASGRVVDLSV